MFSILTLLTVLMLSIIVTRIATVALTHTGLSRQAARFQARSAFTGVGFTTNESEKVVNHPLRRRILLLLMLLGNAGIVTAMSSLILSFMEMRNTEAVPYKITLMICGLVLLWVIASSHWIDRKLSNVISFFLKRYTKMDVKDYSAMLHLAGEYIITELQVEPEDWLADRDLNELKLINEGLIILGITRNNGSYIGAPHGNTVIKPWDTLIIYGRASAVEEIDQRKKNIIGDLAHAEGELKHKELVEEESKTDPVQRKDPSKGKDARKNS